MSKLYDLRLKPGFPGARRMRAGIEIPAGKGVQTELTDEQFAAIKADPEILYRVVKDEKADAQAKADAAAKAKADKDAKDAADAQAKADAAAKAKVPAANAKQMVDNQKAKQA